MNRARGIGGLALGSYTGIDPSVVEAPRVFAGCND